MQTRVAVATCGRGKILTAGARRWSIELNVETITIKTALKSDTVGNKNQRSSSLDHLRLWHNRSKGEVAGLLNQVRASAFCEQWT